jgi:hypothetical protein
VTESSVPIRLTVQYRMDDQSPWLQSVTVKIPLARVAHEARSMTLTTFANWIADAVRDQLAEAGYELGADGDPRRIQEAPGVAPVHGVHPSGP